MSIIFRPDTCDCVMEYEKTIHADGEPVFVRMIEKCEEHSKHSGLKCYKEVLKHNRSFNKKYGNKPTNEQIELISVDKRAEKSRIKKLKSDKLKSEK